MDALGHWLFEDPTWVYTFLAVAAAVLAALWYRRRDRRWLYGLAAPAGLALAAGLTAHLVRTDREQIAGALRAIARSAESGDLDQAAGYLDGAMRSPAPGGHSFTREELIARCRGALAQWPVQSISCSAIQTELSGANATTTLTTRILFGGSTLACGGTMTAKWRLQWARRPDGWRVTRLEPLAPPVLANWSF